MASSLSDVARLDLLEVAGEEAGLPAETAEEIALPALAGTVAIFGAGAVVDRGFKAPAAGFLAAGLALFIPAFSADADCFFGVLANASSHDSISCSASALDP